ncbi:hypothetical protein RY831_03795 [Noviherbaspirillum sp. CPCC 100848]|uniref:Uncharacterized protein n=1 Tax=Noviherbaspirillum album TaxID=3080276 RepID=A0ABU6J4J0_9BURK|nr:hypothetical protein [Noviherbaspirillum sp. CPCC 100848]MEC4718257.1 hypothetical protein [Noviherbaspirillum sp. CPCC 100848]
MIEAQNIRTGIMGFWDIAGKIGRGAAELAVDIAKELPSVAARQAQQILDSGKSISSEQKQKLQDVIDKAKR